MTFLLHKFWQQMNFILDKAGVVVLLYDLYCSSAQRIIPSHGLGLYFTSNVIIKKHIIGSHKISWKCQSKISRVKLFRIISRRKHEPMAVITFTENEEFADWIDEDVIVDITLILEDESDIKILVYSMKKHIVYST